jgi:hypothetical protein
MRRFNYTGRRELKQASVELDVVGAPDGTLAVKGLIDLEPYGDWPADARVVVEAWQGPVFERITVGKADCLKLTFEQPLQRFRGEQSPQFRVKVISESADRGRLLGLCQVRARRTDAEGPSSSMLHVTVEPLDHEIFKLRLEENKHPVLVINEKLSLTPLFLSMVMPQVFRAIITDLLLVRRVGDDVDEAQPDGKWLTFARSLNGDDLPASDDLDSRRTWVEDAGVEFARNIDVMTKFKLWSIR